jgi:ABC-type Fe3+ transport system substrate-binding protein
MTARDVYQFGPFRLDPEVGILYHGTPGIVTGSSQTDAARALVTFLSSPAAQTVLKAKGFE